jgi:hypothetical protein
MAFNVNLGFSSDGNCADSIDYRFELSVCAALGSGLEL